MREKMENKYDRLKLENQLCFPLYACSREVIKFYKPFLDELDLTYTQYITMLALWEEDHQSVKELGRRLMLDSGTLTPLLKKMEAKGIVNRQRSKLDERNLIVSLTAAGKALREKAVTVPERVVGCLRLEPEEAMELYRLLHKLMGDQ